MQTLIIEMSTILTHLIGVYIIFNLISILFCSIKITLRKLFNPFREYKKGEGGAYFFVIFISLIIWLIFYGLYVSVIQKYNFIITW